MLSLPIRNTPTHRFGADAVFRCKDTVMSDQDLDAVLERGAKKTKDMQSKLNVADKGDMLDFSFDDGTGVQVGDGVDGAFGLAAAANMQ